MAGLAQLSFPRETKNAVFVMDSNLPDSGSSKFIFISGPPTCNCKALLTAVLPWLWLITTVLSPLLCICFEMLPLLSTWICLNTHPFTLLKHGSHTLCFQCTGFSVPLSYQLSSFVLGACLLFWFITSFYHHFSLFFYGSCLPCTAALFHLQCQNDTLSPL